MIEAKGDRVTCGFCRGSIFDYKDELGRTKIYSISPNDQWLFDNLRFKCPTCLDTFDYEKALTHPNSCPKNEGFQPPEHIHNWTESKLALMNVPSNPIINAPPRTKDRLIILHYKGEQVFSKFIRCNNDIGDIKTIAARMLNLDANELSIIKFQHSEMDNAAKVSDIAQPQGATYLSMFRQSQEVATHTALLSFNDTGPLVIRSRGRD